MSINVNNINTGGAVITIGGTVNAVDVDGYYWGTVSGTDLGCTTGGISVAYSYEKTDIFCDQTLAAVETAITSETCEITVSLLETAIEKLQYAIGNATVDLSPGVANKLAVGGLTTLTYQPLKLEITDSDTALLITWTFFKVLSNGIDINFERDNPTQGDVTFTVYADTTHAAGHQLFSIYEALA